MAWRSPHARTLCLSACVVGLVTATTAQVMAQDRVYRCQDGSRVSYAHTPCIAARGRLVDVDDQRTPEQRQAALDVARREATFASQARRERLAAEREASLRGPSGIYSARHPSHDERDAQKARKPRLKVPRKASTPKRAPASRSEASKSKVWG